MVKNVCQTYLEGLKEFHFKLFLALALVSEATRPHLGVSEHPPNPQFQGLKIDLCGYCHPNYFSRSAPANGSEHGTPGLGNSAPQPLGHYSIKKSVLKNHSESAKA